jgi:hypothetical protein
LNLDFASGNLGRFRLPNGITFWILLPSWWHVTEWWWHDGGDAVARLTKHRFPTQRKADFARTTPVDLWDLFDGRWI